MAHDGEVGREVEGDEPRARFWGSLLVPCCLGLLCSQTQSRLWQAIHQCLLGDQLLEGLGGIKDIVGELGGQLAQLLLDLIEALAICTLQFSLSSSGTGNMLSRTHAAMPA